MSAEEQVLMASMLLVGDSSGRHWQERWCVLTRAADALQLAVAKKRGGRALRSIAVQAGEAEAAFDLPRALYDVRVGALTLRCAALPLACEWAARLGVPGHAPLSPTHANAALPQRFCEFVCLSFFFFFFS